MTNEEVIRYLEESKCDQKHGNAHQEMHDTVLDLAIQALEKEIAIKGIPFNSGKNHNFVECGSCHGHLDLYYKYCTHCGQHLDWSDD